MLLRRFASRLPSFRNWRTAGHPPPPSLLDDHPHPPDLSETLPQHSPKPQTTSTPTGTPTPTPTGTRQPTPPLHAAHRATIRSKFPSGWSPPRKLSREAMDGLRLLHRMDPTTFSTPTLASRFRISPEAVRRILKSKWSPSREEQARFALRERQRKDESIKKSILQERMRAREIGIERELEEGTGGDDSNSNRTRRERGPGGRDLVDYESSRDGFTFQ